MSELVQKNESFREKIRAAIPDFFSFLRAHDIVVPNLSELQTIDISKQTAENLPFAGYEYLIKVASSREDIRLCVKEDPETGENKYYLQHSVPDSQMMILLEIKEIKNPNHDHHRRQGRLSIRLSDLLLVNSDDHALSIAKLLPEKTEKDIVYYLHEESIATDYLEDDTVEDKTDDEIFSANADIAELDTLMETAELTNENKIASLFHELGHLWAMFLKVDAPSKQQFRSGGLYNETSTPLTLLNRIKNTAISEQLANVLGWFLWIHTSKKIQLPLDNREISKRLRGPDRDLALATYDTVFAMRILELTDTLRLNPKEFFSARYNRTPEGLAEIRKHYELNKEIGLMFKELADVAERNEVGLSEFTFGDYERIKYKNKTATLTVHHSVSGSRSMELILKNDGQELLVSWSSDGSINIAVSQDETSNYYLRPGQHTENYEQVIELIKELTSPLQNPESIFPLSERKIIRDNVNVTTQEIITELCDILPSLNTTLQEAQKVNKTTSLQAYIDEITVSLDIKNGLVTLIDIYRGNLGQADFLHLTAFPHRITYNYQPEGMHSDLENFDSSDLKSSQDISDSMLKVKDLVHKIGNDISAKADAVEIEDIGNTYI